ncbi:hypothetical protein K501DRAFT_270300 [Backusella circina FSU 941]|nr:hypothetical protein K501DRAFT_270300 [Backusella circina FSU 941]
MSTLHEALDTAYTSDIAQRKTVINCIFDRDNQKLNNEIENSGEFDASVSDFFNIITNSFTECIPSNKFNPNPIPYFMFSSAILTGVEFSFNISCIKRWSLLPMPLYKIVHFPISRASTMHNVLRLALKKGLPIPENCYSKQSPERQIIWETIFNLDHVQKKRMRYELNTCNTVNKDCNIEFDHGVKTDGHMISTLFINNKLFKYPFSLMHLSFQHRLHKSQKG